jgi:predicted metal-binding membrane protein
MSSSSDSASSLLPHRDRVAILSALIGVSVLAWAYVIYLWAKMPAMDVGAAVSIQLWTPADFVFMFVMWAIMMVGMMLPSAAPMTLLYAGMVRKAERQGTPMAPMAAFVSGYLAMWCLFSVGATLAQWGLHEAALLAPMMMGFARGGPARTDDDGEESGFWCDSVDRGRGVSTDSVEDRLFGSLSSPCEFFCGALAAWS